MHGTLVSHDVKGVVISTWVTWSVGVSTFGFGGQLCCMMASYAAPAASSFILPLTPLSYRAGSACELPLPPASSFPQSHLQGLARISKQGHPSPVQSSERAKVALLCFVGHGPRSYTSVVVLPPSFPSSPLLGTPVCVLSPPCRTAPCADLYSLDSQAER